MKTDNELRERVESDIGPDPRGNAAHISVAGKNGIITLRGQVSSFADKDVAENITR
jgi:osmotically-inducible protein OsmY